MTVETAAASSPEPAAASEESDARLTRLHDALQQLRAKSAATVPLSSIAPTAATPPVAAEAALPPVAPKPLVPEAATSLPAAAVDEPAPRDTDATQAEAAVATEPEFDAEPELPAPPEPTLKEAAPCDTDATQAEAAVATEPEFEAEPELPAPPEPTPSEAAPSAPRASGAEPVPESPLAPDIASVESQAAAESFSLEAWFSNVALRQYRQLASSMAAQLLSCEPAAIAIATLSSRHEASMVASRLALCLAERQAGDVLLIEPSERRLRPGGAAPRASLIDVVAGRAAWGDAVAPAPMTGLSLSEFGWAAAADDAPLNDQWRAALADLKRRFRYVLSAARPGENSLSDAWLAAVDGVYLAVGLGDVSRGVVAACQLQLKASGARLLGCIALK